MSDNMEYLALLPVDVLGDIIHKMDVITAQKLQETCRNNDRYALVESECARRLSTTVYLDEYFGNGTEFMKAMSKCGACITGPRASGFFVRSSTANESIWEISVNYDDENAFEFLSDLSNIGVKWYTAKEEVTNLLNSKNGTLTLDRFKYASTLTHIMKLSKQLDFQICNSLSANGARIRLFARYPILSISDAAFDDDSVVRESVWMCTGYKSTASGHMKIRLSGERGRFMGYYPKSVINDHSTYRQAILGPYFAYHLYGKLTCDMLTYQWGKNMIIATTPNSIYLTNSAAIPGSVAELTGEFKYEPTPNTPLMGNFRSVTDSESIWLDTGNTYHHEQVDVYRYVELLKGLTLLQSPGGLSSSVVNQVRLTAMQPWVPFRNRHRMPIRDTEGVYIPSLWTSVFGDMVM
jgi:hypothetical protein